ncbi:hypothetical protein Y032_0002g1040 [Ancylostoma ceylanicum]|nr:hypothetical protein Y032_0002g1040 [Ancylostoma ceylanicum]
MPLFPLSIRCMFVFPLCLVLQRFVTKIRRKVTTQQAVLRKHVSKSLHMIELANSLRSNGSGVSEQPGDAVVEFESNNQPAGDEELTATTTQDDLNRAFLVVSEGPDPRLE